MNRKLKLLAVFAATFMAACGDVKHSITPIQNDPSNTPSENNSDGEKEKDISIEGRLVVSSYNSNVLTVMAAKDGEQFDSIGLTGHPQYLHATGKHRYAMAVQRDAGLVEFIDGGVWQEDHGDHLHPYEQAPSRVDFTLQGVKPTHVNSYHDTSAVFFDGDKEIGENAQVMVFSEAHITNNEQHFTTLHYDTYQHGAMQVVGDHLISTIRDEQSGSVLPTQVGLYASHDDHFDLEKTFDVSCPSLHGSAQNEHSVAFACADGVVFINKDNEAFSHHKVNNPSIFSENERIGSLRTHSELSQFIGITGAGLYVLDPATAEVEKLEWQASESARLVSAYFSLSGTYFVTLDSAGTMTIFSGHNHDEDYHWEPEHTLNVTNADVSLMPEDHGFVMALSQSQQVVYVSDPINKHIVEVNLETGTVTQRLELDIVPQNLIWLGIGGEISDHDH